MKKNILSSTIVLILILSFFPDVVNAGSRDGRVVTDMAGRTMVINREVKRIITTFKPSTLFILCLGLQHKLVGIDTSSKRDKLTLAVFPDVIKVTGVGSKTMGINFETLVSLKPDLVILYPQKNGLALAKRLETINIPSIVIIPETFATIKESLRLIALAAGRRTEILNIEQQMDAVLSLTAGRLSGLKEEDRKRGYFASTRGIFSTTTGNMLQDEVFRRAGIINVSHDLAGYFQDISPEQLIKWNPDVIVLSQHMKKQERDRLENKALLKIEAVSGKKVFQCPSNLAPWDFPSPMSVLASLWLAEKVYPERFSDIDIKKKINDFHYKLFGKTLTQMGGIIDNTIY